MSTKSSFQYAAFGIIVAICMASAPAFAAIDIFLKIPGIAGNSRIEQGAIDVTGYAHNVKSPRDASSGLATGRRQHKPMTLSSEISCVKWIDKASPLLMKACAQGEHIKQATLHVRKSGEPHDYIKITLSDCIISSYASNGQGGEDDVPMEDITLTFLRVDFEFRFPPAEGQTEPTIVSYGYDLVPAKK